MLKLESIKFMGYERSPRFPPEVRDLMLLFDGRYLGHRREPIMRSAIETRMSESSIPISFHVVFVADETSDVLSDAQSVFVLVDLLQQAFGVLERQLTSDIIYDEVYVCPRQVAHRIFALLFAIR